MIIILLIISLLILLYMNKNYKNKETFSDNKAGEPKQPAPTTTGRCPVLTMQEIGKLARNNIGFGNEGGKYAFTPPIPGKTAEFLADPDSQYLEFEFPSYKLKQGDTFEINVRAHTKKGGYISSIEKFFVNAHAKKELHEPEPDFQVSASIRFLTRMDLYPDLQTPLETRTSVLGTGSGSQIVALGWISHGSHTAASGRLALFPPGKKSG